MADISLSAAVRSNLLSLRSTVDLIDRTQGRLSTGQKVSSAKDDAVAYFQAKSLSDRASDLSTRKDAIDQGVSSLDTTLKAADALEDLTKQIKGIIDSARSADSSLREKYQVQIKELVSQVQKLVNDATYQGLNLLNSTSATLSVRFSDKGDSKLDVNGVNFNASAFFKDSAGAALGITGITDGAAIASKFGFTIALSGWNLSIAADLATFNEKADSAILALDATVENLRAEASNIANNIAILNVRLNFTEEYVNVLEGGSAKLTVADLNEEGANLLTLQTRQQLGIQALSFAGQSEQSILGLFR
jgi:flagellin-like hook-associated protein FlgL